MDKSFVKKFQTYGGIAVCLLVIGLVLILPFLVGPSVKIIKEPFVAATDRG